MIKMKMVPYIVIILASVLTMAISEPNIKNNKESAKKISKSKLGKCCSLGVEHGGKLKINTICSDKSTTTFELEFLERSTVCTILQNITLTDNTGKKYKPKGYSGIAHCPENNTVKSGDQFYWSFEALDPNANSFSLSEVELAEAVGLNAWHWKDISLSHCKGK